MNVHDPWRVEGEEEEGWNGSFTISLGAQSLRDRSGVRALFVSTYSLPGIHKVIIDHSTLDHTIPLLDTLGCGGERKAGLHLLSLSRLQRLGDETLRVCVHYFPL